MILSSLLAVVLPLAFIGSSSAQDAQAVLDSIHNATGLPGTWSSGAKNVLTGANFANPHNMSFTYPKTTGISYSFTGDGYYESSRYRFTSNGSHPTCITGVVVWSHGTYTLNPNGSITMKPFGDGFQQVQDPCAAVSNFIEPYNDVELYQYWRIYLDASSGYHLHLYQFDGSPLPLQYQVSTTPNMLPTQLLRNVTNVTAQASSRDTLPSSAENLRRPQWILGAMTAVAAVLMAI